MELAQAPADLAELQAEVGRLVAELQEATQEKIQAAQYGLVVLEENGELKQRCGELEGQLDRLSSELTQMKEGELRQLRYQLSNTGAESERLSVALQDLRQVSALWSPVPGIPSSPGPSIPLPTQPGSEQGATGHWLSG
uniref:Uncharacterized protein n=1 Tax=Chelonoidis abingdonii TaxID=106734 RepID=A0A8C0J6H2_CHEAB